MKNLLQANLCVEEYRTLTPEQQELFDQLYATLLDFLRQGISIYDLQVLGMVYEFAKVGTKINFKREGGCTFLIKGIRQKALPFSQYEMYYDTLEGETRTAFERFMDLVCNSYTQP